MGYFKNINLVNFRNFETFNLDFSNNCNVLFGKNGSGKTNLLEAISLFTKGRGIKKDKLSNMIKKNCDDFIIKSDFQNSDILYNLTSKTQHSNSKVTKFLSMNDDTSKKTLDYLYTHAPFLFFVPENERLFLSSPSNRRNFIDRFIFTHENDYNKLINQYNRNLLERSRLLMGENYDSDWLDIIEKNISNYGLQIYLSRQKQLNSIIEYLNFFLNKFNLLYTISFELIDKYHYKKIDDQSFIAELKKNRKIDTITGGSKIGPHKSDYVFYINNEYLVSQLSTGQQKTIILLFLLSQCKYLVESFNKKPILLLDEICSHLDEINRSILLTLVESLDLQVFMTGTTKNLFSFLSTNAHFCNITN